MRREARRKRRAYKRGEHVEGRGETARENNRGRIKQGDGPSQRRSQRFHRRAKRCFARKVASARVLDKGGAVDEPYAGRYSIERTPRAAAFQPSRFVVAGVGEIGGGPAERTRAAVRARDNTPVRNDRGADARADSKQDGVGKSRRGSRRGFRK